MQNKIFTKVYAWMFLGLLISFITGYYISTNENMIFNIFKGNTILILALVEIGVVIWLSAGINKMSTLTAKILYILYSIITGVTLSTIFLAFEIGSIIYVFGITSLLFGIMSIIGKTTKMDLSKMGTILLMGLIGIIIASIINMFIGSDAFDLTLCIIGIIIFTGYIVYDVSKIKYTLEYLEEDKAAIIGAFELYLDFINLFLKLIRLFGKRND